MKFAMMTKLSLLRARDFSVIGALGGRCACGGAIDPQKSSITVRVFKAGIFSAFGHEHEISAPMQQGSFTENPGSVE